MAKMPSYSELTASKKKSGSMPSYNEVMASKSYTAQTRYNNSITHQRSLIDRVGSLEDKFNNWITGDRREDISSDIDAYERALEALRRYGKDTKAASEWIAGIRDDNNRSVRQNLIDDVGEAKDARKGTVGQYLLRTLAGAVAGVQGNTEGVRTAQQEAAGIAAQRRNSRQQQREAEEALAAHREKYGQNLVASEILEQAYKDEDEAIRSLAAIRNSNRPGRTADSRRAEMEKQLQEAQATITELGGVINASAARGAAKSYVGNTGAGLAYGLKGQDTRKRDSNIAAGEAALSEALESAVMSGDRQEEQRLRTMVDAINRPGADKATILAEFLPGIAEVTDEVAIRDRRADLQRQALGNKGYAALKEMAESGSAELDAAKAGKSEVEKVLIDVAVQGGNMAADAAIGLTTGGAMTPMALRSYGAGVIAAESAGASQRDAMLYGMASAGVEMLTEKLADGFLGVYGEGVSDHLTDYVIGKLAKTEAGRAAWGMLFSAGGEATEEFISGIVDPMLTSLYNGKTVAENYSETEMGDIMYDALIGGILGFMGGSVEGLTRQQSGAANFFRNAAEAGLSPRQAAQVWAETGMEVPDNRTVKRMSQEVRSAVVEEGKQSAKGTKSRELAEAKSGKKLRISDVQAQTIANNLAIRREEADAELASKDVKNQTFDEKKAGDVKLDVQGRTIIDGKISDSGVAYTLKKMGFAEAVAEDMARQYQPGTMTEGQYAMAMNQAYQMARTAIPATEVSRDSLVQYLTPAQRDMAIGYGSFNRMNAAKERQKTIRAQLAAKPIKGAGKVLNDTGHEINIDELNDVQKRGLQVAQILTKVTTNNVHVFESVSSASGRVMSSDVGLLKKGDAAPNGWYDHKTGDIYIDLNAGKGGEGTVLYTLGHEYTHFVKAWSPEKFDKLAEFLFENADINLEAAIKAQIDKAARNGREIDRDEAMEEAVADAMEAILSDTNAAEKILELRNKDKSLWEKLKSLFLRIRNAVREAYKEFDPDSDEGLMLKRMDDTITEKLATLFAEGVADAAENYSRANIEIDAATESVAPSMSLRTWTKSEYVQEREETAKKISKTLGVSMEKAYEYIDSINSVAKLIADDAVRLDYEPNLNESATALKPNSEYKYTVDMSTLCAKRLLFTGTFDAIQKALPNVAFDSDAIVHLRKMMMDRDYQVACGICYVESTRREIGTITKEFIERYKIAQQSGKPITRLNSEGKEVELQEKGTKRTFMAEEGYTPTLGDLNTTDIDIVQRDHPDVYAAYLSFMNARGQAKPKLLETRTEYKGEILKSFNNKRAVASRNAAGGLRLQSFSDFEVPHLIDMMQVVMDMSRVGLMSQAYTKVPAFARAFGETGVKINLSLIAKDDGIDADGNLIFDDVEGINHEEAFAIREQHSKNVGTILVGKNDAHIIAAMADPRIDFIIPFHKSSWKESLYGALGLTGYQDYTSTQNERPIDPNRKIANFAPSEYWDYSKSGDENAQIYLQKCREDGRIPKFPEFQSYPGYWKLLIDFKMYDNDGVGAPQQVVQPVFDDAVNAEILAEYKGGHQSYPVAQDVVDDFVREYKEGKIGGEGISFSYRGKNKDGIEVYETSAATLALSKDKRKQQYLDMLKNDYRGRTARFVRNGHTYYAHFDRQAFRKHIFGDKRTDKAGKKAIINAGADGDVFDIVQNAKYTRSSPNKKQNVSADYFDYFVKTVQIDNKVYDLIADVEKFYANGREAYIYTFSLQENKNIKASPALGLPKPAPVKGAGNASGNNVAQGAANVNSKNSPSLRDQATTDRYVLTNAEGQNDTEIRILAKYREESGRMAGLEDTLEAQRATLKEFMAMKPRDTEAVKNQREEIRKTEARIGVEQGILKRMEESATLRRVLKRERENDILEGYERGRFDQGWETAPKTRREMERVASEEFLKGYERGRFDQGLTMAEQQRRAMEYAEKKTGDRINRLEARLAEAEENERRRVQQLKNYRQNQGKKELLRKIGKTTKELNDWLAHPSKDKHIPSDLIGVVVEALDAVNMDTVNAEERLAILDRRIAEVDKSLSVTKEYKNRQRLEAEREKLVRQQNTISKQGYRMRENLSKLQSVYNSIRESDDPVLAGAYDENISAKIQEVWETVGDTPIREMSVEQLQTVYDLYRMVSKTARNANKAFRAGKAATVEGLANSVMGELGTRKRRDGVSNARLRLEKRAWSDLKPVYAFKTIGSDTMTELFNSVRAGEDTWAKDVSEARDFYLGEAKKHGANDWDMNEKFSFTSTSGLDFELTLGDIMSIYAYSKREQALDHLAKGGVVLQPDMDKKGAFAKVSENATAYNLSPEILMEITGKLTAPQKAFADAMQRYLSTDMGAKGNDVSMELYDVKLFNEENYFPLRSSKAYMARAKEQQKGEVRVKNSGFTKAVTPSASNPIVLQPFMEVWSEHVSDMAMYHAFTLPLEDFYRVYNYKTKADEDNAIRSVNADIQNIYGKAAIDYIDTLLRDINGGARGDNTIGLLAKGMGKMKKAAVMASASVVVQQPSAIARAFAHIPVTYFIGPKVNAETHDRVWNELKKYAPIAIIKEIGAFDQNVGKRTVDWIAQKEYDGFMEKAKAFVTDSDYRDDAFGYLAGKADEITWVAIWEAAKRMAADTTSLQGEALLRRAGEIFTDTVVNTQVYDSVLSRSQLMRSKDNLGQMLTAFMGEPTTTLNMLYDAVLQGKRGNKAFAAKTVGAVTASIVLNSALVSFVKAARDDDDDQSYWEKYVAAMLSSLKDGIDVRQMIPYIRDLVSIGKGFDVERTDVSVYSDVLTAWNKLRSAQLEDEATAKEYVDFIANVGNALGIPMTNLIRDGRAVRNVIVNWDEKTTAAGLRYAAIEGISGKRTANNQQLYEAIMAGDTAHTERVMGRYETQKEADSDLRKYFREADPRVKEAALARYEGRTADYESIINDILNEGKLSRNVVVEAIRAEEEKLDEDTVSTEARISSLYTQGDLVQAMKTGDNQLAHRIRQDIVDTAVANGKTVNEAQRQFKENASKAAKEAFIDGSITANTARAILKNYSGKSQQDANDVVEAWKFEKQNGWAYSSRGTEYKDGNITRSQLIVAMTTYGGKTREEANIQADLYEWQMAGYERASDAMVKKYNYGGLAAAGISKDIWYKAYTGYNDTKGVDADGDGKTDAYSKVNGAMEKINALPITAEQKTLIALQIWSQSTVRDHKLW